MLEKGLGAIEVLDDERQIRVENVFGDSEGFRGFRLTGPGLSVVYGTQRIPGHLPPMWKIQMLARDEVSIPDDELLSMIEEIVRFTGADYFDTEPSEVIATFYPERYL